MIVARVLGLILPVVGAVAAGPPDDLSEIFRSGRVRLVPEIVISDENLGGKTYFSGGLFDLALDDRGRLYVCDPDAGCLLRFDAAGAFLGPLGKTGQGPGEFGYPAEVEWARERLYVRELLNRRVSILDRDGTFVRSVLCDMSQGMWWKMRALPDGRFVVEREKIDRENLDAPQVTSLDLFSPELEYVKTLYRAEVRRNKYVRQPRFTNVPVPFAAAVHWDVTGDGRVAIGHSARYEIEIHDPDTGRLSSFSHPYEPVAVTAADKKEWFGGMTQVVSDSSGNRTTRPGADAVVLENTTFPARKPPFTDLRIDAEGNVWVVRSGRAGETEWGVDVFAPTGRFIASVKMEAKALSHAWLAVPGGFWGTRAAEEGTMTVVKTRITR